MVFEPEPDMVREIGAVVELRRVAPPAYREHCPFHAGQREIGGTLMRECLRPVQPAPGNFGMTGRSFPILLHQPPLQRLQCYFWLSSDPYTGLAHPVALLSRIPYLVIAGL